MESGMTEMKSTTQALNSVL